MSYVLWLIGLCFVVIGLVANNPAFENDLFLLFGVLIIGIGELIGIIKRGFARLERRLPAPPVGAAPSSWQDRLDDWFAKRE